MMCIIKKNITGVNLETKYMMHMLRWQIKSFQVKNTRTCILVCGTGNVYALSVKPEV